jgi:hypothetical protein
MAPVSGRDERSPQTHQPTGFSILRSMGRRSEPDVDLLSWTTRFGSHRYRDVRPFGNRPAFRALCPSLRDKQTTGLVVNT